MTERRSWRVRVGHAAWQMLRDYAKRVWDNSGEDNVFFLASGISFDILLAIVPFFLLFATGLTYLLNESTPVVAARVAGLMDTLLPPRPDGTDSVATQIVLDIIKARGTIGVFSAIGFVWFSTRLFGSLRYVLGSVFDIETDRGIVQGKIFDIKITVVSSLLLVVYTGLSAYLAIATSRGVSVLEMFGLRKDVMGGLEYTLGRCIAFAFIVALFYGLYKYLPFRKIRWQMALIGGLFTGFAFELAKAIFALYVSHFRPGSLYTGTIAALVITILWVYYAGLVFILGGEVAQVHELRRMRRLQQLAFED